MSFPRYPAYKDSGVEWMGEVPEHWEVKRIASLYREVVEQGSDELPVLSVSIHHGVSDSELSEEEMDRKVTRSEDRTKYKRVTPGDLVYNMMRAWQGAFGTVCVEGMVSPAYVVARPTSNVHSTWIEYLLRTDPAISEIKRFSRGITDFRLRLYWDEFKNLRVCLPPSNERGVLLRFLDCETTKIDALIAEQQRLIELLQEKRQAVISHAVTKGLNPDAPMKDSGVEWLGEVPEHWIITRLGRISTSRCDGPFGSGLKSEHYVDSGVLVVRLQNIKISGYDPAVSAFIDRRYYSEHLGDHDVEPGDLLIAGLGDENNYVGRACVAPDDMGPAMVKADCFRFRLASEMAAPGFIASSLNASASFHAGTLSSGSTRSRIPLSVMAIREIALPPLDEQIEIISSIKSKLSNIDQLQGEAVAATVLLQERRSALISAAVTGQIDVRGLVGEASAA